MAVAAFIVWKGAGIRAWKTLLQGLGKRLDVTMITIPLLIAAVAVTPLAASKIVRRGVPCCCAISAS